MTSRGEIHAVFFDAVGTLIYPNPPVGEAYARIGRRWGATLSAEEAARRFGAAFARLEDEDRDRGYRTDEAHERRRWSAIVAAVFGDQPDPTGPLAELWEHFARPDSWACFADAAAALDGLHAQNLSVGIASNFDGRLRRVLAGLPALRSCRHLAISSELGWRKPAPQFFQKLCDLAGLPPERILLIGDDRENDCRGGQDAGLQTLLLNRSGRCHVEECFASLAELPRVLSAVLPARLGDGQCGSTHC